MLFMGLSMHFRRINHPRINNLRVGLLVVTASVLYNSWPLGYILDPAVGRHALASELQAPHHPYNWLFILTDVLAGIIVIGIGAYQFKRFMFRHGRLTAACIMGFGLLVALAAITPLRCDPTTTACGPLLHHPVIVLHGFASVASVVMLFIALVVSLRVAQQRGALSPTMAILMLLLLSWLIFAGGAVFEYMYRIRGNALQDYFITVCSLSLAVVVVTNQRIMHQLLGLNSPIETS